MLIIGYHKLRRGYCRLRRVIIGYRRVVGHILPEEGEEKLQPPALVECRKGEKQSSA